MLLKLSDAKNGDKLKIVDTDANRELIEEIKDYSLEIGKIVEVVGIEELEFYGPILVKIHGATLVIPRGVAERVDVDGKTLSDLKEGDSGEIDDITGLNKEMMEGLSKIGIKKGNFLEILGIGEEKIYTFQIDKKEIQLGTGEAAKVLVKSDSKIVQSNFLKSVGIIHYIIGGMGFLDRIGNIVGKEIRKISTKDEKKYQKEESFLKLKVEEDGETIVKKELAEKIVVERV